MDRFKKIMSIWFDSTLHNVGLLLFLLAVMVVVMTTTTKTEVHTMHLTSQSIDDIDSAESIDHINRIHSLAKGIVTKTFNHKLDINSDCCRTYNLFNCTGTGKFDRGLCLDCDEPDRSGFCGVGQCNKIGCGCKGRCRRAIDNPHAIHLEDQNEPIYT